jgi:hypothetical protein
VAGREEREREGAGAVLCRPACASHSRISSRVVWEILSKSSGFNCNTGTHTGAHTQGGVLENGGTEAEERMKEIEEMQGK